IRGLKRARCLPQTEWRVARQRRQAVSYDLMVVESPKPGSYDGARPSEGTPCQTDAGAEIGFVRPPQPASDLRPCARAESCRAVVIDIVLAAAGHLDRAAGGIERCNLVDAFDFGQVEIVPQSQIQGQLRRNFPIVLEVVARR